MTIKEEVHMKKLRDIMTTDVRFCIAEDNVFEAASKMAMLNVGFIPIVSNGQLIGVLTDRDIVLRGVAEKRPNSTPVTEIMTTDVITATPDMSTEEAAELMAKHQIRRLPVVEGTKLVGIVALGDLAVQKMSDEQAGQALSQISETHERTLPGAH